MEINSIKYNGKHFLGLAVIFKNFNVCVSIIMRKREKYISESFPILTAIKVLCK